jgi:predicted peroxiredoxin
LSKDKIETEDEKAIREWLEAGNKVTVCEPDLKTEEEDIIYKWVRGRPKPK